MFAVQYMRPQNLESALDFLKAHGGHAVLLAGGTDVMIDLRAGSLRPRYLVDIGRLPELGGIEMKNSRLIVGAAVTISEIERSETIARWAPALRKAAETFASRQVRNVATIGGNVAHCSPCGDTVPPLLIHEAEAHVAGPQGRRVLAVEEMAAGPYRCSLNPGEIITHFALQPKPADVEFADFQKIGRRKELAIARLSMAAMARRAEDQSIAFFRFALGSCTPTPRRFPEIEDSLNGRVLDEDLLWEAGGMLADRMLAITGTRPSAVYKRPAVQGLFVRLMLPLVG